MKDLKLGKETGSLFNHLMSSDSNEPNVEKGATLLFWTDRNAVFINSVSDDKKTIEIEFPECKRIDKNGMSDCQDYEYIRVKDAPKTTLRFTYGKWRHSVTKQPYNISFSGMNQYYDYSF